MRDASLVTGDLKVAGRLDARFFALLEAALNLAVGQSATAVFKAYSVMLAVLAK